MSTRMALSKIPDSTLAKLRCRCGRYLSSAPVSVCQDGQSLCKDCVDVQASNFGMLAQNFSYEAVANLLEFPCRYKPQGCPRYMEFNKITEHEDECSYRAYQCPVSLLSSCNKRGTASQLCQHYEQDHPELYLKYSNFIINVHTDFELYRLFKVEDVVLLLQTKCSLKQDKLWFSTIYFGNATNASLLRYNIKLSSSENKGRVMELEEEKSKPISDIQTFPSQSLEVDISVVMAFLKRPEFIQCHWIITVPEELKNKIKKQHEEEQQEIFAAKKERLKCPNCGIYMVPPIYSCNKNHLTCVDCKSYDSHCWGCQKNDVNFTRPNDLERLALSGLYYCRWVGCNQQHSYDKIRSHEQGCLSRLYKCPECNSWSGIHDELLNHFKSVHTELNIYLSHPVPLNFKKDYAYVIIQREIFKIVLNSSNHNYQTNVYISNAHRQDNFIIKVYYLNSPMFAADWKYQIYDTSMKLICDLTKSHNNLHSLKTGTVPSNSAGTYSTLTINNISNGCYNLHIGKVKDQWYQTLNYSNPNSTKKFRNK